MEGIREGFLEEVPSKKEGLGALVVLTSLALTLCRLVFTSFRVNWHTRNSEARSVLF